jgi:hypothetical protein
MKIKHEKPKVKFESKLGDDFLALRNIDSNAVVKKLEDNIKLREMPIEMKIKKGLNQKV